MEIKVKNEQAMRDFGVKLGALFEGGEVIELVGDVGAGKTTLMKAVATGMGVSDSIGSPSYTLSQSYIASPSNLRLVHYDFYRLDNPGVLAEELREELADSRAVVAIEWANIVADVLPTDHLRIQITPTSDEGRVLALSAGGEGSRVVLERLT